MLHLNLAEIERLLVRFVLTALALSSLLLMVSPALAQGAFYKAAEAEIMGGPPGSIIREESMGKSPPGGIHFLSGTSYPVMAGPPGISAR